MRINLGSFEPYYNNMQELSTFTESNLSVTDGKMRSTQQLRGITCSQ